jgi:hypothetical protein
VKLEIRDGIVINTERTRRRTETKEKIGEPMENRVTNGQNRLENG